MGPAILLCLDSFAFVGVQPACIPKECTEGLPLARVVAADSCVGIRTGELCDASCIEGYTGAPRTYLCHPDGILRDHPTGHIGLQPTCLRTSSVTVQEDIPISAAAAALPRY